METTVGEKTAGGEGASVYTPSRTKALPRGSLFGTALEIVDGPRREGEDVPLSSLQTTVKHMPDSVKDNPALSQKRANYERQKDIVKQTTEALREKEKQALTFRPDQTGAASRRQQVDRSHHWFTSRDLEHSKDINVGMLTDTGSFNRDKYGRRPPGHTYSQIGDILQAGMDLSPRQLLDINGNYNPTPAERARRRRATEGAMQHQAVVLPSAQPSPHSVVALPPNIRHQFGSRICDSVLSDEAKVSATLASQERARFPPRRGPKLDVPGFPKPQNAEYDNLSNATRQNVFPGYTMDNKLSTTKTVYSDSVHLHRYPDPDEFRYQRDELSTWAEHNVLRERMKRAWDVKLLSGVKKDNA